MPMRIGVHLPRDAKARSGLAEPRLLRSNDLRATNASGDRREMRIIVLTVGLALLPAAALAEGIDPATLASVEALAKRGYADPEAAVVRNVHKSLARNGMGYCGEVSVEGETGAGAFTVFHAIIASGTGPSVLRLVDFAADPLDPNAMTVIEMMRSFGCTE
jgi:hypothetical protein